MLSPGDRLGPYQVVSPLGAGGMGEVYRARDTRLGREVALKVLPDEVAHDPGRLKRFEREARATASLSHPNVLTVFDVGSHDGRSYVVSEILDGATLAARLRRGPIPVREALSLAARAARGLAAAHARGIVHRDVKPENLFVTTSGTLKVLDFGLASLQSTDHTRSAEPTDSNPTDPGSVLGTVSYMSPEQVKGLPLDARSDLFSLGVVLHEMLSGRHPFKRTSSAETVSAILRDDPPDLAALDGRVPGVIGQLVKRCLGKRCEDRFQTATDLAIALDLLLRSDEPEARRSAARTDAVASGSTTEERPYPGLSSFTEADSAHFFGREDEVRELWEKIRQRRLLAIMGPSGAGKTSFLRAGILASKPTGWAAAYMTPGPDPAFSLAQSLTPQLAGDTHALASLVRGVHAMGRADEPVGLEEAIAHWRARYAEVLLVIDQAEELFTQARPEALPAFSSLLGRLAENPGIHVLVALRDDFLFRCAEHPSLAPVFHDLTPLTPPSAAALRRALVEPAARQGVRFDEPALVDEMLSAVSGERGALPMLAFAAARLWDERDRERKVLTTEAYRRIGGVEGALAQHAEAALDRVGSHRIPLVRELFRNLVTAQGTMAVREREELLSVFPRRDLDAGSKPAWNRDEAREVLDALVDARLLTSYERQDESGEPHQQVEIVHESLLASWPRLVRWRTQDADGMQLRDHLRQAAQLWHHRGRPEDLLWSGTAYRDVSLWRERHPLPLSAAESEFVLATEAKATRRRRLRRAAVAGLLGAAASVAIVTSVLWQRAEAETRRGEASRLLALAQLERENYPTAALAYATKSLELSDTPEARLFALGILQEFPTAQIVPMPADDLDGLEAMYPAFSPNGEWLAVGGTRRVLLLNRDGRPPRALGDYPTAGFNGPIPRFGPASDRLITARLGDVRMLSAPDGRVLWRRQLPPGITLPYLAADGVMTLTQVGSRWLAHAWALEGGEPRRLGSIEAATAFGVGRSHLVHREGKRVFLRALSRWDKPVTIGKLSSDFGDVAISRDGRRVAASDDQGKIWIWDGAGSAAQTVRTLEAPDTPGLKFDSSGRKLAAVGGSGGIALARVFDLQAPPGAMPLIAQRSDEPYLNGVDFDPEGRWLAVGTVASTALWALGGTYPHVLKSGAGDVAFTRDGQTLLAISDGGLKAWSLSPAATEAPRLLLEVDQPLQFPGLAVDPSGQRIAIAGAQGWVRVLPVRGGRPQELQGFSEKAMLRAVSFAEGGRLVAAAPFVSPREEKVVRVWNLETGEARSLGPVPGAGEGFTGAMRSLTALSNTHQLFAGVEGYGLVRFDLDTGSQAVVTRDVDWVLASSPATGLLLGCHYDRAKELCSPVLLDPERGTSVPLATYGDSCHEGVFDPTGTLVATGSVRGGTVRVGRVSGEEPHVLVGHGSDVQAMAFSPDGHWLAVADKGGEIRLWPVPDVTRTPFHLKPHAEVMAALRSHTNLRVVADPAAARGYKLEPGPFHGWPNATDW